MQYKLYKPDNPYSDKDVIRYVLANRGIESPEAWRDANLENSVQSWSNLDHIQEAVSRVHDAMHKDEHICVIVDPDADGYTSSSILINYLYTISSSSWVLDHITYKHHTGKQHGLSDIEIEDGVNLVICPDSASNDYEFHQSLNDRGIDVIVLDHHEAPYYSEAPHTIVVNNQLSENYLNKDFSGAGIVWQFCRAYDDCFEYNYANNFLDLCALGNLGDMMSYTSLETKAVIEAGLKDIRNPFLTEICEAHKYSIDKKGGINYMSMAFYVVPYINAIVRTGTAEEKDAVFRSMCLPWAFEEVESHKRGHQGEQVPQYKEGVRIADSVKYRQTKLQNESMSAIEQKIKQENLLNHAALVVKCEPGEVEPNLAGLVANKLQAKYQRPSFVLIKNRDKDDGEYHYKGSARNYSMSEEQDLRTVCESSNLIDYAQGHANAHGFSIKQSNLESFNSFMDDYYKEVNKEPVYWVEYIWNENQVDSQAILTIAEMAAYWGQEIPEAKICLEKISLDDCDITLMSKDKNPTLKITLPNGLTCIKFKSSEEEYDEFCKANQTFTAIISCNKNEWNGTVSAQGLVENFELGIRTEWIF